MERRAFINSLGIPAGLVLSGNHSLWSLASDITSKTSEISKPNDSFRLITPFDGGVLHERHGAPVLGTERNAKGERCLKLTVSGTAPKEALLKITGPEGQTIIPERQGNLFSCPVLLQKTFSEIKATCTLNGKTETITTRPIWHKDSYPRYTFQIDDCGFFLRDLYQKKFKSILDCFFLSRLKKLHNEFGVKVVLNCFYSPQQLDFNLGMLSDSYKMEFERNADWLRLTFHAKTEFPDDPYKTSTKEKVIEDYDLVMAHLRRISGSAAIPTSCTHFANFRPEVWKPMYERGTRFLCMEPDKERGRNWCSYQVPQSVFDYMLDHEAWKDYGSGLVFMKTDIIINCIPLLQIKPFLQSVWEHPAEREVLGLLTHEQYCWSDYKNYLPDHFERMAAAFQFASDHGYKPVWHLDCYPGI